MEQQVQFRHIRRDVVQNEKTVKANNGGLTIAMPAQPVLWDAAADAKVSVGVAVCSDQDNFSYKRGRVIATGRLNAGAVVELTIGQIRNMVENGLDDQLLSSIRAKISA